ncbi:MULTISPECIES: DUF6314 family protein [unclassified Cobetia]|uniref:DUF6314 family protein n=1 Tax=unclassified Cobetia TaxID=2609414 RepID=UPI00159E273C|nr:MULTISPECIES: DUF6314 family protein [unclassified Cobetia]MCO7231892.1 DUF6314 family protein [Cobetia sp. Dlab-2-AX]MCO7234792.1 DUF6314 family protein [Cobetia sp. Dlab-2-U]NVN55341.1 hypothetical protein [bacterium Scap17]
MTSKPGSQKKLTPIVTLYALLAQIHRLDFSSRSGPASRNAWSGQGSGEVTVTHEAPDSPHDGARQAAQQEAESVVFLEQGQFQLKGQSSSVNFHNRYRWQLAADGEALSLSHERRGRDAAVFLFDLVADSARGEDHFVSREAHLCIDDLYAATLVIVRDEAGNALGFDLDWRITGPRKDEHLAYRYRC